MLAGRSYTLLGVMPPGVRFPVQEEKSDFIMPLEPMVATDVARRCSHFLHLVGRLKPGLSVKQAEAEMKPIAARLEQQYPDTNTGLLASLLNGVGANDLVTYAIVLFLLGAAAFLASYIPARRAMKIDPMVALRYE